MEREQVRHLLSLLIETGETTVSEFNAKKLLRSWGLPVPPCGLVDSSGEAVELGERLGYPLALKVHSPSIIHKSDVGGVQLNLNSVEDVEKAYVRIETNCSPLDADFKVLVQPMAKEGLEVILGVSHDPQFGPALMFGIGGLFVELFKDVSFRLIPIRNSDALDMIHSIKALPLLEGYRGKPGADIALLADIMVSVSDLVTEQPLIHELDINPLILYPDGATVVDARMGLSENGA